MTLAQTERAALADLFDEVGPDQPTLCEGWNTADLLAHLLLRERRMDAALALVLPPLRGWNARVAAGYRRRPWAEQVGLLRSGPPVFTPFGWGRLDALLNGLELFIHHEDVRRGRPDWEPRELGEEARATLVPLLTAGFVSGRVRKLGIPVTARLTDEPEQVDRPIVLVPARQLDIVDAPEGVVLHGGLAEIHLWLSGRTAVRIEFEGDADDIAQLRADGPGSPGR